MRSRKQHAAWQRSWASDSNDESQAVANYSQRLNPFVSWCWPAGERDDKGLHRSVLGNNCMRGRCEWPTRSLNDSEKSSKHCPDDFVQQASFGTQSNSHAVSRRLSGATRAMEIYIAGGYLHARQAVSGGNL